MTQETTHPESDQSIHRKRRFSLKRLLTNRRVWAVFILLIGLWLVVFYGTRTLRAYREIGYAREQGLLDGTASVDAIQPWMTIRYIAVAYAVPEEYIYAKLNIPFDRRSAREPLGRLGRQRASEGPPPAAESGDQGVPPDPQAARDALLVEMREIILAYRANPVAPGLRDIRPWMSLAYIANSTGVPVDYLVDALVDRAETLRATEQALHDRPTPPELPNNALDTEESRYKPLDLLSDDLRYP
ncbi:MAG: hypothetical protein KDE19_03690, partial [Caldilineaceae bacterium]|nr:hypothetical protein [Caldilineaceae bacterium]